MFSQGTALFEHCNSFWTETIELHPLIYSYEAQNNIYPQPMLQIYPKAQNATNTIMMILKPTTVQKHSH